MPYAIIAAGAILQYLEITEHHQTAHITSLSRIEEDNYVWLDKFTIRNLELFNALQEGARTLIDVLDQTHSPMGARLLKRWMALPLKDIVSINDRLNIVEYLFEHEDFREDLIPQIKKDGGCGKDSVPRRCRESQPS